MWTYDGAGNILSRKEYTYTTAATSSLSGGATVSYGYGNSTWGDLLTKYGTQSITYDPIGNTLSDGEWLYTWEHGRQLAAMTDKNNSNDVWTYTYDANGMRTGRTNGSTDYTYVYNCSQLSYMTYNDVTMWFIYGPTGAPVALNYDGEFYYYLTNIQGDVIGIVDTSRKEIVTYSYDAWGNIVSMSGVAVATIGANNPLRYRGYVYDQETGLYYLQSRYYNPAMGRFISIDNIGYLGADGTLISYNLAQCLCCETKRACRL